MDSPSIPITVLTGFLGSGKTTLANVMLRDASLRNALVLVNEVGDISIDHHLMRTLDERTVVLPSGCVCCAVRDDLVEVLGDESLLQGRDRVWLETSGLADPTPLVATLLKHPALKGRFHLERVIVTLDPERAADILERYPEAPKQLALADVVVVTKCDQTEEETIEATEELARSVLPDVLVLRAAEGRIIGKAEMPAKTRHQAPAPPGAHEHTHGVRTFVVGSNEAAEFPRFAAWLSMMSQLNGEKLIRLKGLLRTTGSEDPMVIQSVQHVVYPTYTLPGWPDDAPRTQLVGITCGMSERLFEDTVASLRAIVG